MLTLETCSLLAGAAEAVTLLTELVRRGRTSSGATEERGAESAARRVRREALLVLAPGSDATEILCVLTPDEPAEHVGTADGEEEEAGDECEVVAMMGKYAGANAINNESVNKDSKAQAVKDVQGLEDSQSAETKFRAQDGEEAVKVLHGPADLGQQENDDLQDDEQMVDDRPEDAGGLVGHVAASASWSVTAVAKQKDSGRTRCNRSRSCPGRSGLRGRHLRLEHRS